MKFRLSVAELSVAFADLGVLLPLTLSLITLNHLNATAAFAGIGLAYLVTAFAYRLPIPVQPLKSLSATALALGLSPLVIVAGAWWMTLFFVLLALTPSARRIERLFPTPIVRGIQLGLGFLLLQSAWGLVTKPILSIMPGAAGPLLIALGAGFVLVIALRFWRDAAALAVISFGIVLALIYGGTQTIPSDALGIVWPTFNRGLPAPGDFWTALWLLALPQLPLSMANSVYSTTDAARQYFDEEASHVTPRRLLSTMTINNALAALLGGVPVCHGCGGLTAHYRLGARTGAAPLILGMISLGLAILGGRAILSLLALIPFPALGILLAYVGLQHAWLAKDLRGWRAWLSALSVALVTLLTRNLALGFAVGAGTYFSLQRCRRMNGASLRVSRFSGRPFSG